ncbi:unnamed protein product, partial [Rotaria sp. Silwood2]
WTFVAAGHETTSNSMTWTMYVLMTNEQVLQVCRDEVDRVLPNGTELTYEHMNELMVCEAVLQETLRLYPPAPFLERQYIREYSISNKGNRQMRIPVGARVLTNTYILHRRAEFWCRIRLYPLVTRSSGPHNCIGQNFSLLEAKVILALLVQRCNFEIEAGQKIVPDISHYYAT